MLRAGNSRVNMRDCGSEALPESPLVSLIVATLLEVGCDAVEVVATLWDEAVADPPAVQLLHVEYTSAFYKCVVFTLL